MKLNIILSLTVLSFSAATEALPGGNSSVAYFAPNSTTQYEKRYMTHNKTQDGHLSELKKREIILENSISADLTERYHKRVVSNASPDPRSNYSTENFKRSILVPSKHSAKMIVARSNSSDGALPLQKKSPIYGNSTQMSTQKNDFHRRGTSTAGSCALAKNVENKCDAEDSVTLRDCVCVLSAQEYWNSAYECYLVKGTTTASSSAQFKFQFCKYRISRGENQQQNGKREFNAIEMVNGFKDELKKLVPSSTQNYASEVLATVPTSIPSGFPDLPL